MGWTLREFWCDPCHLRMEALVERDPLPASMPCTRCGAAAERVISAPKTMTVWGTVQRGKNSKDDIPPRALNTEALADGMSMNEFRARRRKQRAEWRRQRVRQMVS